MWVYTRMSTLVSSWLGSALWKYLKMAFQLILVQRKNHCYFRKPASIRAPSWKKSHGSGLQLWGNDEVSRTVLSSATFTTTIMWYSPNLAQYQHHFQSFWGSRSSLRFLEFLGLFFACLHLIVANDLQRDTTMISMCSHSSSSCLSSFGCKLLFQICYLKELRFLDLAGLPVFNKFTFNLCLYLIKSPCSNLSAYK